ncbi:MAG: phosphoglycerate mutase family protein [Spirochaetes bacterium]|jgi:broad specificity phosphatase PhoE|nr:phosphoglycerate mutase family protein [Spirochaetota bacterium]
MGSIYFLRHGQASFGEQNYDSLCENGKLQSRILGEYLAGLGIPIHSACSGEMNRQMQTAGEVISVFREKELSFPELNILSEFNEFEFAEVVKNLLPQLVQEDPSLGKDVELMFNDRNVFSMVIDKVLMKWMSGGYDRPGMTGWQSFKDRIKNGVDNIIAGSGRGSNILVFSSGGTISAVIQMALGISDEITAKLCWQINNASITRFVYVSGGIILAGFNNIAHLEMKGDKGLITYR